MKVIMNCNLDSQLQDLINRKQKDFGCIIIIKHDEETDCVYMSVLTFDHRSFDDVLISTKSSKDKVCVGIMKWFRANKDKF